MRWCLLLQNYQYTIEHRPNIQGNTLEQTLAYKQVTDKDIVKLRESLEKSEHPLYELRNGLNYSRPTVLISDRGSCFTSNLFKDFIDTKGKKHILIAAGTPRANGQMERMNSIITPSLSKFTDQNQLEWDDLVAEIGINNTINRATGETPAKLLFGRNQLGEVQDNIRETLETIIQNQNRNLEEIRLSKGNREIGCKLKLSRRTVGYNVEKYREVGTFLNKKQPERPKVTSPADDWQITTS
ncbi:hypothetical protein Trydic_g5463 [Trypoxylus dichotomus]